MKQNQLEFIKNNRTMLEGLLDLRINEISNIIIDTDDEETRKVGVILAKELKQMKKVLINICDLKEKPEVKENDTGV